MTLLTKQILNFLKLLNSDKGTTSISWGIVCGMVLGFTPAFSLQTLLMLVILFFFRVQIGAALLAAAFFAVPAYWLDPLFDRVGCLVLEAEGLQNFWTSLNHLPPIPLTRFNNSIVMGSAIVSAGLAIPVFFISKALITKYREHVVARFKNTRWWKSFTATSFYQWYMKYEELHG